MTRWRDGAAVAEEIAFGDPLHWPERLGEVGEGDRQGAGGERN
jgi:hypothetical protein